MKISVPIINETPYINSTPNLTAPKHLPLILNPPRVSGTTARASDVSRAAPMLESLSALSIHRTLSTNGPYQLLAPPYPPAYSRVKEFRLEKRATDTYLDRSFVATCATLFTYRIVSFRLGSRAVAEDNTKLTQTGLRPGSSGAENLSRDKAERKLLAFAPV